MFFLLRMAFWLGVVLVLLPTGASQRGPATNEVGASEAISAASATVEDLRGFCGREPHACAVGSQVAIVIGYRARAGAKMLYDILTEALAPRETGALASGSGRQGGLEKSAAEKSSPQRASQDTLTPVDLAPVWRGPAPRKDGKRAV